MSAGLNRIFKIEIDSLQSEKNIITSYTKANLYKLLIETAEETGFIKWTKEYYDEWAYLESNYRRLAFTFYIRRRKNLPDHLTGVITPQLMTKFCVPISEWFNFFMDYVEFANSVFAKLGFIEIFDKEDLDNNILVLQKIVNLSDFLNKNNIPHVLTNQYCPESSLEEAAFICYENKLILYVRDFEGYKNNIIDYISKEKMELHLFLGSINLDTDLSPILPLIEQKSLTRLFTSFIELGYINEYSANQGTNTDFGRYDKTTMLITSERIPGTLDYTNSSFQNYFGYHAISVERTERGFIDHYILADNLGDMILKMYHKN